MAEALYRKYRPQIFADVVGQEHIERTIKNAIEQDKVSHAYLFTGPRGTGKTTTARLLAKALLCEKGPTPEPDGSCEDCRMVADGVHPDVYELDAASRTGVENVREEIIGRVQFAPTRGRFKIYIIDEVHMLSTAAFNALLKTLEEPPSHVVFVLATTDPQKVPETIHSRCQRFDFRRISNEAIVSRLGAICVAEGVEFEGAALELIAHRAEGGMRNALTSLEQMIAFGEGRVTMEVAERMLGALATDDLAEIVGLIGRRDAAGCFKWTAEYVETGADLAQFTRELAEQVRNLYVLAVAGEDALLEVSETARRELAAQLPLYGADRLARMLGVLGDLCGELKTSSNPRLSFEIALTRMVRPASDLTMEALAERVEQLWSAVASATANSADAAASPSTQSSHDLGGSRSEVRYAPEIPRISGTGETLADLASSGDSVTAEKGGDGETPVGTGPCPVRSAEGAVQDSQAPARTELRSARPAEGIARDGETAVGTGLCPVRSAGEDSSPSVDSRAWQALASSSAEGALGKLRNPAALQRMWQNALSRLKKVKMSHGVLFFNTKVSLDDAASKLIVEFPEGSDFSYRTVQKPDFQDVLADVLAAAFGAPVPFALVMAGAPAAVAAEAPASARFQEAPAAQAASPARQPREEARPEPASQVREVPAREEVQPSADPFYDEVPLDAYGDVAGFDPGYGDEPLVDDAFAQPAPAPGSNPVQSAPDHAAGAVGQTTSAGPQPPAEVDSTLPAPEQAGDSADEDIFAALAFGFGEGMSFTEVSS